MEPGKILHEVRECELARLGEVPFRRYYGSVDSTPLFVALAGLYWQRTRDRATLQALAGGARRPRMDAEVRRPQRRRLPRLRPPS